MGANRCNAKPSFRGRSYRCIEEYPGVLSDSTIRRNHEGFNHYCTYFLENFPSSTGFWGNEHGSGQQDPPHFGHKLKQWMFALQFAIQYSCGFNVIHLLQNQGESLFMVKIGSFSRPVPRWSTNQSSWKNLGVLELFQPATR